MDGIAGDLEIATGYCGKAGQRCPPAWASPTCGSASSPWAARHERRPRGGRAPGGRGRPGRGRRRCRGVGREPHSRQIRVYEGEVESLSDAGGRGVGVRAFAGGRCGLRLRHRPLGRRAARRGRRGSRGGRCGGPRRVGGLPDEFGTTAVDGPGLARARGLDDRAEGRAGAGGRSAPPAPAGREPGGGDRLLGRRGVGGARQLARFRGRLRAPPRHGPTRPPSRARAPT